MTKKKHAASQQVKKAGSVTNHSKSAPRSKISKTKRGAKVDSYALFSTTKDGYGYTFLVFVIGMNLICEILFYILLS